MVKSRPNRLGFAILLVFVATEGSFLGPSLRLMAIGDQELRSPVAALSAPGFSRYPCRGCLHGAAFLARLPKHRHNSLSFIIARDSLPPLAAAH